MKISRQVMLEWSWPGLELRFLDDDWFFPHISGFCQIRCHFFDIHRLRLVTIPLL